MRVKVGMNTVIRFMLYYFGSTNKRVMTAEYCIVAIDQIGRCRSTAMGRTLEGQSGNRGNPSRLAENIEFQLNVPESGPEGCRSRKHILMLQNLK